MIFETESRQDGLQTDPRVRGHVFVANDQIRSGGPAVVKGVVKVPEDEFYVVVFLHIFKAARLFDKGGNVPDRVFHQHHFEQTRRRRRGDQGRPVGGLGGVADERGRRNARAVTS